MALRIRFNKQLTAIKCFHNPIFCWFGFHSRVIRILGRFQPCTVLAVKHAWEMIFDKHERLKWLPRGKDQCLIRKEKETKHAEKFGANTDASARS